MLHYITRRFVDAIKVSGHIDNHFPQYSREDDLQQLRASDSTGSIIWFGFPGSWNAFGQYDTLRFETSSASALQGCSDCAPFFPSPHVILEAR
jgi:hypothetical protein